MGLCDETSLMTGALTMDSAGAISTGLEAMIESSPSSSSSSSTRVWRSSLAEAEVARCLPNESRLPTPLLRPVLKEGGKEGLLAERAWIIDSLRALDCAHVVQTSC